MLSPWSPLFARLRALDSVTLIDTIAVFNSLAALKLLFFGTGTETGPREEGQASLATRRRRTFTTRSTSGCPSTSLRAGFRWWAARPRGLSLTPAGSGSRSGTRRRTPPTRASTTGAASRWPTTQPPPAAWARARTSSIRTGPGSPATGLRRWGGWLGTERMRTSYNGSMEGTYSSLPWGDGKSSTGADIDANHYAQLDHDPETDTDHAQFRQYSNKQGRFFSPDPYDGSYDASNPQSMNRYTYAMNNPLSMVDPSGLLCALATADGTIEDGGDQDTCGAKGGTWYIDYQTVTVNEPMTNIDQQLADLGPDASLSDPNIAQQYMQLSGIAFSIAPNNGQEPPPACQAK